MEKLRLVLRANAASCIGFGALFVAAPAATASFLGDGPALLFQIIGAGLVLNGLHLIVASLRAELVRREVQYFSVGDFLWGAGTLALLAAGAVIQTPAGIAAALAVGAVVVLMGALQVRYLPA